MYRYTHMHALRRCGQREQTRARTGANGKRADLKTARGNELSRHSRRGLRG